MCLEKDVWVWGFVTVNDDDDNYYDDDTERQRQQQQNDKCKNSGVIWCLPWRTPILYNYKNNFLNRRGTNGGKTLTCITEYDSVMSVLLITKLNISFFKTSIFYR